MSKSKNDTVKVWHEVYPVVAYGLFKFYKRYREKTPEVLYDRLRKNQAYTRHSEWISDLRKVYRNPSIDPVQIFSSFNRPKQTDEQRINIINILMDVLGAGISFSKIEFQGCPSPVAVKIRSVRDNETARQIWGLSNYLFNNHKTGLRQVKFEIIKDWYGLDIPSYTIFLFWIAPRHFIPLDKNTFRILQEAGIWQSVPQSAREYAQLLPRQNVDFYIELARNARSFHSEEEERNEFINWVRKFYRSTRREKTSGSQCRLVAIRTLPSLSKRISKVLDRNRLFRLYNQYQFEPDGTIVYSPSGEQPLYDIGDIRVDVSAIVGKNGSGKSALTEMLILAINNIASKRKDLNRDKEISFQRGLHIELYFHSNILYRVNCHGEHIFITEYFYDGKRFIAQRDHSIGSFDLTELFFTIYLNYSSYALNTCESGAWLDPLFKKNDSYQVPLSLCPYREEGNYNINTENLLVRSRLLSNLLERTDKRDPENFRKLTDSGKYATHLSFQLRLADEPTISVVKEHWPKPELTDEKLLEKAKIFFGFKTVGFNPQVRKAGELYIIEKLKKIAKNYPVQYGIYVYAETGYLKERALHSFFRALKRDRSHVTYKLRQAINYFRFRLYARLPLKKRVSIEALSLKIDAIRSRLIKREKLRTIELIPPPFLTSEIFLDKDQSFKTLSSGEKQKIYSVSSIVYHLNNVDSVGDENELIAYRNVNILFDELELYYHPDMQRSFVDYLLRYVKRASFSNIRSLHLCFVTHSPFILSDIFDSNTLYLDKGLPVDNAMNGKQTFAGNIHDLLVNSFFLKHGLMGVFAKRQIRSAIAFLGGSVDSENETEEENGDVKERLNEIAWNQDSIRNFISKIGEPLLRESLMQLYGAKYISSQTDFEKEVEFLRKSYENSNA